MPGDKNELQKTCGKINPGMTIVGTNEADDFTITYYLFYRLPFKNCSVEPSAETFGLEMNKNIKFYNLYEFSCFHAGLWKQENEYKIHLNKNGASST